MKKWTTDVFSFEDKRDCQEETAATARRWGRRGKR
jgi:hypothetical protein